jgi:integrase
VTIGHFGSYILLEFGSDNITDVTPPQVLEFRTYLLKQVGLSLKTSRNIIDGSFRAMMRDARTIDHLVSEDPFAAIRWPTREVPEPDPFTEQERDELLRYFRTRVPFYYPFLYTLFWTGMRPSEATALRVGDVDLRRGTPSITRSRHIGEENAPKTRGSRRVIRLLPTVVELIKAAKQLRVTESNYVFTNTEGGPIDADQWRKDYWYKALRATGIDERKFYARRHTYISRFNRHH